MLMALYLISYDLRRPDFDYSRLYKALERIGAARIQESVWGVRSNLTGVEVYELIWPYLHDLKDRLLVTGVNGFKGSNSIKDLSSI
jgi:hypothetical protein